MAEPSAEGAAGTAGVAGTAGAAGSLGVAGTAGTAGVAGTVWATSARWVPDWVLDTWAALASPMPENPPTARTAAPIAILVVLLTLFITGIHPLVGGRPAGCLMGVQAPAALTKE
ncbi:hypothetical protein E5206_00955 [Arthrobacter sp. PAMC25564]|nr:hypothetical protein E5206_00955 [Arthrobacter sp. PAMC25564]